MKREYEEEVIFHPGDYTILIVDDNPQNLKVVDTYLRERGFKTLIASKGELALNRIQYTKPDLILLDVLMPGIDGFDTCLQLKANRITKDIPVIFMTALIETEYKIKGFEVGAVDYITKPFHREEVLARVTTHLQIRKEIAERKRAEAALRDAHEEIVRLEKAALELQMAGGFAHEMRNALAGIQLALHPVRQEGKTLCERNVEILEQLSQMLKESLPRPYWKQMLQEFDRIDQHEETLNNVLHVISDYTNRAMEVTTIILNYARLGGDEAGGDSVYLHSLIETIAQEHSHEFDTQQISLRLDVSPAQALVGNPAHFYMMLNNLVLNARDALLDTADESERVIDITLTEHDHGQTVRVADTGHGIPKEYLSKIFEPFFSTKPTTGTGLGLSVVSKLVPMYQGSIHVDSKAGKGTTVTLTFPVQPDEAT